MQSVEAAPLFCFAHFGKSMNWERERGRQLGRPYCVSDAMRLHPKQRNTLIKGLHPIAGSVPTGCISAWQFSHSRVSRTRSAIPR